MEKRHIRDHVSNLEGNFILLKNKGLRYTFVLKFNNVPSRILDSRA
jgi:hypothetical protein